MGGEDERVKPHDGSELEPRPHAVDIYERVCDDTVEELERPPSSLAFSGLFAGFTIGLAPLAYALALITLGGEGDAEKFVAALVYPIGYIAVIIGRAQFFTENTLYPVMVTMRKPEYLRTSSRLWAIVYATNLAGALLFAMLAIFTGAFGDPVQANLVAEGVGDTSGPLTTTFWSAVVTGWLLALVAWLVEASEHAIGQIAVIWAITLVVGLGGFDHCIATTVEAFSALLEGPLALGDLLGWLAVTTVGNIAGGVMIVAAINYGQVRQEDGD
jgi:formate/nitrite transporter FocA (FNT family)